MWCHCARCRPTCPFTRSLSVRHLCIRAEETRKVRCTFHPNSSSDITYWANCSHSQSLWLCLHACTCDWTHFHMNGIYCLFDILQSIFGSECSRHAAHSMLRSVRDAEWKRAQDQQREQGHADVECAGGWKNAFAHELINIWSIGTSIRCDHSFVDIFCTRKFIPNWCKII